MAWASGGEAHWKPSWRLLTVVRLLPSRFHVYLTSRVHACFVGRQFFVCVSHLYTPYEQRSHICTHLMSRGTDCPFFSLFSGMFVQRATTKDTLSIFTSRGKGRFVYSSEMQCHPPKQCRGMLILQGDKYNIFLWTKTGKLSITEKMDFSKSGFLSCNAIHSPCRHLPGLDCTVVMLLGGRELTPL